jgi:hypothetical protein
MLNIGDDNELDNLSREAAEKYRVPSAANWDLMQAELDKHMPVEEKKRRFLFWWWLLPGLLLGGIIGFRMINSNKTGISDKHSSSLVNTNETKQAANNPPKTTDQNGNSNLAATEQKTAATEEPMAAVQLKKTVTVHNGNTNKTSTESSVTTDVTTASGQTSSSNNHADKPADTKSVTEQPADPAAGKTTADVTKNAQNHTGQTATADATAITKTDRTATKEEAAENNHDSNTTNEDITQPAVSNNSPEATKVAITKNKGWSVALLGGVDKSTVKFKYDNGPGYNTGLLLGYQFNKKLSVHTGAIYTQKNYKVAGIDFHPPKGSWASYYNFSQVDGYCRMWEVPLLLRYYLGNGKGKTDFFLSTGISSYFMTKEKYTYYYVYNGQPAQRTNTYPSSDTHLLSILHLSAGLDKQIGQKWSMLIEPYAKIPLGGVGFGSIQLSSFGINLSLQYKQPSRK